MTPKQVLPRLANGIGGICNEMRVLFVGSGNHGEISPIIKSQGDSLSSSNVEVSYYLIKGKGLRGYLCQVKPLRWYLKSNNFDVIHAHYSLSAFTVSLAGAKPLVVSLMGSDVKATRLYKLLIRLFAWLFRWKEIIVKSKDMYDDLEIGKAMIVPNGVNLELFKQMDQNDCRECLGWDTHKKHILFPANPSRQEKDFPLAKGSVDLLDADVELHVFENVDHQETPRFFNAADVVLLTSKWEGSPNVIKEAMACCVPIVTTNVGDVSERLNGVDGCYVAHTRDKNDVAALLGKALQFEGRTKGREKLLSDGLDNRQVAETLVRIYKNAMKT